ncbi:MAG: putative ABC transporter permease [Oscillospiraceae bacterium]|nr:putative ABC transporter permease [Oscillospiraceae bacterium]
MLKKSEDVLHRLVWLFTLSSLAGFWLESLQSWIDLGYVENRQGLLYGPFTPIYGLGAVLFALAFPVLRTRQAGLIFLITGAAGALFEYGCSLFQETAFGTISWEYSNIGLDWHGRTNLILALCWGGLGVFFTLAFYPAFARHMDCQPRRGRRLLTLVLLCFFLSNGLLSAAALVRQNQRRADVPAFSAVSAFLDLHFPDGRMEATFPNMSVVHSFS